MTGSLAAQSLVSGLLVGMLYLLMALGFSLVFGVMKVVNFAHGEFYMLGGFGLYLCFAWLELPFAVSVALVFGAAVVVGAALEHAVLRPFRGDPLNGMVVTIGLALVLQNGALWIFGPNPLSLPSVVSGAWRLGPLVVAASRLYAAAFSLVVLASFFCFLRYSAAGRALRAVVEDEEIARLQGIRAGLAYPWGFGLGTGLAAIAGALMAPLFSVSPFVGDTPLLKAFIVVILGGFGSLPGAVLGSLILGVTDSVAGIYLSASVADILQFVMVILVLIFRPTGLLGGSDI